MYKQFFASYRKVFQANTTSHHHMGECLCCDWLLLGYEDME